METVYTAIAGNMLEIFLLVLSVIGVYVLRFIKSKLDEPQRVLLEEIVQAAVLYVQQVAPQADPQKKLEEAVRAAVEMAAARKIGIDETTLIFLIEANVKILKDQFGEEWNK